MADVDEGLKNELRRISILLALNVTRDQTQRDQITLLSRIGFLPREIAEILDTSPNVVSVTLSQNRRRKSAVKPDTRPNDEG